MTWEENPWHRERRAYGDRLRQLRESDSPEDKERLQELQRKARELMEQILQRYPELAIEFKELTPEKNRFLQLANFIDRLEDSSLLNRGNRLHFIRKKRKADGKWDSSEGRVWLAENSQLMDELRRIGLMPESTRSGVDPLRWSEVLNRQSNFQRALEIEAMVAVEDGRTEDAMVSLRALRGIAGLAPNSAPTSLIGTALSLQADRQIQQVFFAEILPSMNPAEVNLVELEEFAVVPTLTPADYRQFVRGSWHYENQADYLLVLADAEAPNYPSNPADLIDQHAMGSLGIMERVQGESPSDWAALSTSGSRSVDGPDYGSLNETVISSGLEIAEDIATTFVYSQSYSGLGHAAFAILRGEPIPPDPIWGQPYQWNPETRELALPASPEFEGMRIEPIVLPTW